MFLVLLLFFTAPIFAVLQDCSPKESVILQGKCSLYVNELMFLTEDEEVTLEAAKNISKVCQSVTVSLKQEYGDSTMGSSMGSSVLGDSTMGSDAAEMGKLCADIDSTQGKAGFAQCLFTILRANLANYDCIPTNSTMPNFVKRTIHPNFYDDKECAKELMVGECGEDVKIGFDENWDQLVEAAKNEALPKNSTTRLNVNDLLMA
ncbi:unnamed protein product [Caenorhabditis brenneri]